MDNHTPIINKDKIKKFSDYSQISEESLRLKKCNPFGIAPPSGEWTTDGDFYVNLKNDGEIVSHLKIKLICYHCNLPLTAFVEGSVIRIKRSCLCEIEATPSLEMEDGDA